MKRSPLQVVPQPKRVQVPPSGPSLSMAKKAIRWYRGKGVPKAVYRRNALEWLRVRIRMGDQHILNKSFTPTWGQPGDGKGVSQVFAPRRLGERA